MKVKVYYYNAAGRANQIRLCLAAGGIEFEDEFADSYPPSAENKALWSKLGKNTTTNVPMMTIDEGTASEKVYTQSSAVLRKAAQLGNLHLKNADIDDAEYLQDKILADVEDLRSAAYRSFVMFGAKKEAADKYINEGFALHAKNLQRQLVSGNKPFFFSDTLSVIDVAVYDGIVSFGTSCLRGTPNMGDDPLSSIGGLTELSSWVDRVESHANISAYLNGEQYKAIQMKQTKTFLGY